jgi:hypothetical protein
MDDTVALSLQQFTNAWHVMCAPSGRYTTARRDGAEYIFAGCPVAFFNIAIVTGTSVSTETLRHHAEGACAWAAAKAVPWLFVVTEETLAPGTNATPVLAECGLAPLMPLTGMLAHSLTPPLRHVDDLELRQPDDDDGCSAVLDVNSIAYQMDLEAGKEILGNRSFWRDHFAVVGNSNGKPASCAAVLMVDGYRYVALVATDPAQQRRGFAEAAMRRALDLAARAHGDLPTFLHATEAGKPIYTRMGYLPVANHTVFIERRFMGEH